MLSEPQIQRYARQLLLRDLGERGQEALGGTRVDLALEGPVAEAAAAYLRAGGTEVGGTSGPGAWALTPPLLASTPARRVEVVAAPRELELPGVVIGSARGGHVLWSAGEEGCRGCLREATRPLAAPDLRGSASVLAGSLLALLVQRCALGLAAALEGLEISPAGELSALAPLPCSHRPPTVPAPVLHALLRHLTSALPEEGCAVLLGREGEVRLVPMSNAQDAHHARDPETFPRTARTAFSLDPKAWLGLLRAADRSGERLLAIAHSHPDGGAHFSAEDRRWAAPGGWPLMPGVAHLVVAFEEGRPRSARWAVWADGDFLETDCPLPEGSRGKPGG